MPVYPPTITVGLPPNPGGYTGVAPWGDPYERNSWPGPYTVGLGVVGPSDEDAITAWGGSNTITTSQTITDRAFTGGVDIQSGADVYFENCTFTTGTNGITVSNGYATLTNCRIERTSIDYNTTDVPIRWAGFQLINCEILKFCSVLSFGSRLGRRQIIRNCYIHSMSENRHEGNHREIIHLEFPNLDGHTTEGCWLEFRGQGGTANFSLGSTNITTEHRDVLVQNNVIGGTGNHCWDFATEGNINNNPGGPPFPIPWDQINVRVLNNYVLTDYPLVDNGDVGTPGWTEVSGPGGSTTDTFYDRSPRSGSRWGGTWTTTAATGRTISGNKWWNSDVYGRVQGGSCDPGDPTCNLQYGI